MNIYVGNLPHATTDAQLREVFEQYGSVDSAAIIKDRETGQSRGFGFVEMPNAQEAETAIESMNGNSFGGRTLTVNEARPREERPRSGGGFNRGGGGGNRSGGGDYGNKRSGGGGDYGNKRGGGGGGDYGNKRGGDDYERHGSGEYERRGGGGYSDGGRRQGGGRSGGPQRGNGGGGRRGY